jgi:hypothetical protein
MFKFSTYSGQVQVGDIALCSYEDVNARASGEEMERAQFGLS